MGRLTGVFFLTLVLSPLDPSGLALGREYRALWVDTWNEGILDAESTRLTVARARQHHFNTLFVEVSKVMDAYYQSDILPTAKNIPEPGFDPLGAVLHNAKPQNPGVRPIETHAWIVALRAWKDKPLPSKNLRPPHVLRAHPEWVSNNYRGARFDGNNYFLDPGHPEVQDFVASIASEIVRRYPVDGLHLDYIRYPGNEWGYNPVALERFQSETGRKDKPKPEDEEWSAWRRRQVTDLVRRISAEIHSIRPRIKMSVAAITWGDVPAGDFKRTRAYRDALQDWVGWLDEGYLDVVAPMNYKRGSQPLQARDFVDWVKLATAAKGDRHLITGLGAWFNPVSTTIKQTQVCRSLKSDGVCLFSYDKLDASQRSSAHVLRDLSGRVFQSPTVPPAALWLEKPTAGALAGTDPKRRSGYPVMLIQGQGRKVAKTLTDANGHFAFFKVPTGFWQVQVGEASIRSIPVTLSPGQTIKVRFAE